MKNIEIIWNIREEINETPLWLDVQKIDSEWKLDRIERLASNLEDKSKYFEFSKFIQNGDKIRLPICFLGPDDEFIIHDGKHTFSWFRDHGAVSIPFLVPRKKIGYIQDRFGSSLLKTELSEDLEDLKEYFLNNELNIVIEKKEKEIQKFLRQKPKYLVSFDKAQIISDLTSKIEKNIEKYKKDFNLKKKEIKEIENNKIFFKDSIIRKLNEDLISIKKNMDLEVNKLASKILEANLLIEKLTKEKDDQLKEFRNIKEIKESVENNVFIELLKYRLKTQPITIETKYKIIENIDLALLSLKDEMLKKNKNLEDMKKDIGYFSSNIKPRKAKKSSKILDTKNNPDFTFLD
jgi:hypothetical protein